MLLRVIGFEEAKAIAQSGEFDCVRPSLYGASGFVICDAPSDYIVLDNALVCGFGGIAWRDYWICGCDIQYYPCDWSSVSWFPAKFSERDQTIDLPEFELANSFNTPALFVDCTVGRHNFSHFVHDLLPYGLVYQKLREKYRDLLPAISPLKWISQTTLFERVFDIEPKRFLLIDGFTKFEKLVVVRRQTNLDGFPVQIYHAGLQHASTLARTIGNEGLTRNLKIFLHRTQDVEQLRSVGLLQGRDFRNIQDLLGKLVESGFIILDPGLLSIEAVANLLGAACLVVGVHGANLANIIFCHPATKVVELRPVTGVWGDIEAIAGCFQLEFVAIDQLPGSADGEGLFDIPRTMEILTALS